MLYSKNEVIEQLKKLSEIVVDKNRTFEKAVDNFVNETFGDPSGTVHCEPVECLLLDLENEEIKKNFNNVQINYIKTKLGWWQDEYFAEWISDVWQNESLILKRNRTLNEYKLIKW